MAFDSLIFGAFLFLSFFLYYLLPSRYRRVFLLCVSVLFYASYGVKYLLLLAFVVLSTYSFGRWIEASRVKKVKTALFICSVCLPLLILIFFKYFDFFTFHVFSFDILLPVGISFYTFQAIGYLTDVYRGTQTSERNFLSFALFLCFFPQITAGPIGRGSVLLPQIKEKHIFKYEDVTYGMKLMAWGFFKKLAIADNYSMYVNPIFDSIHSYQGLSLILATFLYTIQIYCDFSGYSDIAIGIARMFGYDLGTNFRHPYLATSLKDFWNRWHISLSTWLRDYIYIPLGGSRRGKARSYMNLLITFLVSGLWHGANWTFVIWGALHGIWQCLERLIGLSKKKQNRITSVLTWLITFCFVAFAWSFFRADSLSDIGYLYSHCLVGISSPRNYLLQAYSDLSLTHHAIVYMLLPFLLMVGFDICDEKEDVIKRVSNWKTVPRWALYLGFVFLFLFLYPTVGHQFIYSKF